MEIMNAIAQIAQMVGVPCVCLGAVMWYVNELDIRQREERKSWYEKHDHESTKWVDALNNNTKVITELLTNYRFCGEGLYMHSEIVGKYAKVDVLDVNGKPVKSI